MPGPAAASSPHPTHHLSRRALFRATLTLALAGAGAGALSGCSSAAQEPEIDPLVAQSALARRDAAAAVAAIAGAPEAAAALTVIADQRSEHAAALDAEIARAAGPSEENPTSETATPPSIAEQDTPLPTLDEIRALLDESHRSAADLTLELDGHRAGVLASIAASCHIQRGVLLS